MLGLGTKLTKSKLVTPGIITDNLVMKHKYPVEAVEPLSDGAVKLVRTDDDNGDYIDTGTSLSTGTVISVACWIKPSGTTDEYMGLIYEDILTGKTTSPLPNSVKDATKFYKAIYADFRKELLDAGELISEAGLKKDIGHYQGALAEIQPITNKLKARKDKLGQEMYKMHLSFRNDIQ